MTSTSFKLAQFGSSSPARETEPIEAFAAGFGRRIAGLGDLVVALLRQLRPEPPLVADEQLAEMPLAVLHLRQIDVPAAGLVGLPARDRPAAGEDRDVRRQRPGRRPAPVPCRNPRPRKEIGDSSQYVPPRIETTMARSRSGLGLSSTAGPPAGLARSWPTARRCRPPWAPAACPTTGRCHWWPQRNPARPPATACRKTVLTVAVRKNT